MARLTKILIALYFALATPAQAKLIAIVFDTSGSMSSRYRLPTFGMELLASTIDGRAGFDRLWAMSFNEYAASCGFTIPEAATFDRLPCNTSNQVKKFSISSDGSHRQMVQRLANDFIPQDIGTPYGPIEVMLNEIANGIQDGEEAILIVVTDGLYHAQQGTDETPFDDRVYVPQMRRSFNAYKERIAARGGQISAEFLFIDETGTTEAKVIDQGVRDTLLEVLNGDRRKGARHVTGQSALWNALTDIVATVSDTDREVQKEFVRHSGQEIEVKSPLSISRVVIVSTGQSGSSIPVLQPGSEPFGVRPSDDRRLAARMSGQDGGSFQGVQLRGVVEHLWFQNAVPPGSYTLEFDGPVNESNVFLLFETRSIADLRIFGADGAEIQVDTNGDYRLFKGEDYTFRSRILDGEGSPQPVDFDTLPKSLSMLVSLAGSGVDETHSMAIDRPADEGSFAWRPSATGRLTAVGKASAGIMSPESDPLTLIVLDSTTTITVSSISPAESCGTCAAGEVVSTVTPPGGGDVTVGTFDVSAEAEIPGAVTLGGRIPEGYEILDDEGNVLDLDQPVPFGAGQTQTFTIRRPADVTAQTLAQGGTDIDLQVSPAGAWTGKPAGSQTRVLLTPPAMGMELIAVSRPPTPGKVDGLVVPGGELLRGQFSAQFSLIDLIEAPDQDKVDELITVEAPFLTSWLVSFTPEFADPTATGFHALDIRPSTNYLCLCFIGLGNAITGSDTRDVSVTYTYAIDDVVLQSTRALLPLYLPIGWWLIGISCLIDAFLLLLFVMFLRGIAALFLTNRFPKGSVVEIEEAHQVPRYMRLDRGNSVFWKAWFALFTGNPDEVRNVEGLQIRATRKGGIVDVSKTAPPWSVERFGESFAEMKENNAKKTEYALIWGDRMENTLRPSLSMQLKRRSSD